MRALIIGPKETESGYYIKDEPSLNWHVHMNKLRGSVLNVEPSELHSDSYRSEHWIWHTTWLKIL